MNPKMAAFRQIQKERTQITNLRYECSVITTDSIDIKRILRECCEQLYADKFDNVSKIHQSLKHIKLSKFIENI